MKPDRVGEVDQVLKGGGVGDHERWAGLKDGAAVVLDRRRIPGLSDQMAMTKKNVILTAGQFNMFTHFWMIVTELKKQNL